MKVYQLAEEIRKDVESVFELLAELGMKTDDPFAEVPDDLMLAVLEAHPFSAKPEAVTLNNFKAFGHTEQSIPLKPITLIFGPNSAGKSSFLHSQLWLHHAFTEGELDVHRPAIAGDLVDLGGLRNVVYKKQADGNTFTFGYSFPASALSVSLRDFFGPVLESLHFEFTVDSGKQLITEDDELLPGLKRGSISRLKICVGKEKTEFLRASRRRNGFFKIDNFPLTDAAFSHAWEELLGALSFSSRFTSREVEIWRVLFDMITNGIQLGPLTTPLLPTEARFQGKFPKVSWALEELDPHAYADDPGQSQVEHYEPGELDEAWAYSQGEDEYIEDPQDQFVDYPPQEDPELDYEMSSQRERDTYAFSKLQEAVPNMVANIESTLNLLLSESGKLVQSYLVTLHYLGSQRAYPERGFTFNTKRDINWKANGGEAWDRLAKNRKLRERVNHWLQDPAHLKTPYKLGMRQFVDLENTERLIEEEMDDAYNDARSGEVDLSSYDVNTPDNSQVDLMEWDSSKAAAQIKARAATSGEVESYSDLYLVDSNSNTIVSYRDVGIGITQLIPILATAMSLEKKTVLIEEPESHLHPKAQTELADVFIDSALKDGATNSFVIETHSEHFILRILRRIRECYESPEDYPEYLPKITPEDVSIIYMDPSKEGAQAYHLRISEDGDFLDQWPNGFFAERREELF